ncbi:MAG TPA: hypothetical protein VFE46_02610 [Pirellulales bacterium]|nr:hypothetical protein [Pirellulales bacterium]
MSDDVVAQAVFSKATTELEQLVNTLSKATEEYLAKISGSNCNFSLRAEGFVGEGDKAFIDIQLPGYMQDDFTVSKLKDYGKTLNRLLRESIPAFYRKHFSFEIKSLLVEHGAYPIEPRYCIGVRARWDACSNSWYRHEPAS